MELERTERSRLRRSHERGSFDRDTINQILDATPQCSVAYAIDGKPYLTPTFHWREGNHLYWHGSSASRMIRQSTGAEVCINVHILDGFVMARSAFHHSANFRSVTLFGQAFKVPDEDKAARLDAFVEGLWPGRTGILRPMTAQEVKGTTILGLEIKEGSAKVRTGPPIDDDEDMSLPIWAGVIPVRHVLDAPITEENVPEDVQIPQHILDYSLG